MPAKEVTAFFLPLSQAAFLFRFSILLTQRSMAFFLVSLLLFVDDLAVYINARSLRGECGRVPSAGSSQGE